MSSRATPPAGSAPLRFWRRAGLLIAAAALLASAPPAWGTPPPALSAEFELETKDAAGTEKASGVVRFMPGGNVCLQVKSPVRQEMLLSARELVIFYPDRDLALIANIAPGKAPPMLDAVAAGLLDPAATLPSGSRLLEQRREGQNLLTRWRVVTPNGDEQGEMRALESRDGALSIELFGKSGKPQRRFSFADRVRVGGQSVPRKISAEYFGANGAHRRGERWTLTNLTRYDAAASAATPCARLRPTTQLQEMVW